MDFIKKYKLHYALFIATFLITLTGFTLTTWKMFHFRDRLHEFTDNSRWEKTLSKNGVYDNNKIVFFGDSQIDLWWMAPSFGSLPVVNKGISGDWALRAVERFDRDVIALKPKKLVMLIGTNDLGNGRSIEDISTNIEAMVKSAESKDIETFLCSVLPVRGKYISNHPLDDIIKINSKLKKIAQKNNTKYIDFHTPLIDSAGTFSINYTADGLHPSRAGYAKMTKILLPLLSL